jgi:hypothetical protein
MSTDADVTETEVMVLRPWLYKNRGGELSTGDPREQGTRDRFVLGAEPDVPCADGEVVAFVGRYGSAPWLFEIYAFLEENIRAMSSLEATERSNMANRDSAVIDRDNFIDAMRKEAIRRGLDGDYNRFATADGDDPMPEITRTFDITLRVEEVVDTDDVNDALAEALTDYAYQTTNFTEVTE